MKAKLHLVTQDEPRVFGSRSFISLTRNPALRSPERFEPTIKGENDVVI